VNVAARRIAALALAAATVALSTATALAAGPTVSQIAQQLSAGSAYVAPAAQVTPSQATQLRAAAAARPDLALVALSATPTPAKSQAAGARLLRARIGANATVAVVYPGGVLVAAGPQRYSQRIAAARSAASNKAGAAALLAFANSYEPVAATKKSSGGGGLAWWMWALIALVAVVLGIALWRGLASRGAAGSTARQPRRGAELVHEARDLVQERATALGRTLAETAVDVAERGDHAVAEHHRSASELVAGVRSDLGSLSGPPDFRHAHESLDEAEWHLGVAVAHLHGTAEPMRPHPGRTGRCFFDARHGLSSVELELELPGVRDVTVGSCAEDAVLLSRGTPPQVGVVRVGRRTVPWAAAPTWFGGWGWDEKDLPALRYQGNQVFEPRAARPELEPEPEPANPFEATSEWDPRREEGWDEEPAAGGDEHGDDAHA
jgi:hypothetical protein